MADRDEARTFEESLLGWLDDAYNLARWLLRDDQDAQDAVQEAFMRAVRFAGGFRGGDRRAWLLAICATSVIRSFPAPARPQQTWSSTRNSIRAPARLPIRKRRR